MLPAPVLATPLLSMERQQRAQGGVSDCVPHSCALVPTSRYTASGRCFHAKHPWGVVDQEGEEGRLA